MKFVDMLRKTLTKEVYAARTYSSDPLQSYRFRVSISGVPSTVGFKSVSGIEREVEVIEYFENMYSHAHKLPGRESVGEVTFERGMFADNSFENEYKTIFDAGASRRDVTVSIVDRFGKVQRSFQMAECWFSGLSISDLSADSSDVIIEKLTMQFERFL